MPTHTGQNFTSRKLLFISASCLPWWDLAVARGRDSLLGKDTSVGKAKRRMCQSPLPGHRLLLGVFSSSPKCIIMLNYLPRKSWYAFNDCAGYFSLGFWEVSVFCFLLLVELLEKRQRQVYSLDFRICRCWVLLKEKGYRDYNRLRKETINFF